MSKCDPTREKRIDVGETEYLVDHKVKSELQPVIF